MLFVRRKPWLALVNVRLDGGGLGLGVIDALSGLYEVGWFGVGDIQEDLRVAIGQGKPGALDLHHDAMAAAEGVVHVLHGEIDFFELPGVKGSGFSKL